MYEVVEVNIHPHRGVDTLMVRIKLDKLNYIEKQTLLEFVRDREVDGEEAVWILLKLDPTVVENMIRKGWYLPIEEEEPSLWVRFSEWIERKLWRKS